MGGGFFSYEEFIKQLHKKKYAYLETLPKSLESALPRQVLRDAEMQEDHIVVSGSVEERMMNLNLAFLAYDEKKTGLVTKHDIRFLLKLFGLDGGYVRFTTGRCD